MRRDYEKDHAAFRKALRAMYKRPEIAEARQAVIDAERGELIEHVGSLVATAIATERERACQIVTEAMDGQISSLRQRGVHLMVLSRAEMLRTDITAAIRNQEEGKN